jgi:hypothetical protein
LSVSSCGTPFGEFPFALDLGIELGAEEQRHVGDPVPGDEHDRGSEVP